jgi:hypothetical protein
MHFSSPWQLIWHILIVPEHHLSLSSPPHIPKHRFLRQLRSFPFDARCCISRKHLVKPEFDINLHHKIKSHNWLRAGPTHHHFGFARHVFWVSIARWLPIPDSPARFLSPGRAFFPDASPRLTVHHVHFQPRSPRPKFTTLRRIARAHRSAMRLVCGAPGVFVANSMEELEDFFRVPAVTTIKLIGTREQTKRSPIRRPNTRNDKVSLLAGKQQSATPSNSRLRTNPSLSEGPTRIALHVLAASRPLPY